MDNTVSEAHVSFIVAEAQRKQLEKPTRAVVNSEAAFVAQRLRNEGYTGIAARYWSWTCKSASSDPVRGPEEFGQEVYDLQMKLKGIDMGCEMPAWGTYGT